MYCSESKEGYLISAIKSDGVWCFCASAPKRERMKHGKQTIGYVDVTHGAMPFKPSDRQGETVPASRECLGYFHACDGVSTDDAKAKAIEACHAHYSQVMPLTAKESSR